MSKVLSRTEQVASCMAAAVLASSAFIVSARLLPDTTYNDFIVGSIAWSGGSKLADLLAFPVMLIVFLTVFLGCSALIAAAAPVRRAAADGIGAQLLIASSLAFAPVAAILIGVTADPLWIHFSSLGLLCLLVMQRTSAWSEEVPAWMPAFLIFCAALSGVGPLTLQLFLSRLPVDAPLPSELPNAASLALTVSAIAMIATAAFGARSAGSMLRWRLPLAMTAQCFTAGLYLCLIPARLQLPDGSLTSYAVGWPLRILVLTLIVAALADMLRRFFVYRDDASFWKILSPLALFPLILILRSGATVTPIIHPDDYHFGEGLIGWWSYLQGRIPYVDYVPAHGLIDDDMAGMLAHLFYGGTADAFLEARRLMFGLLGLGCLLAVYHTTGSLIVAMIGVYFLGGRPGFLFLTMFACLWLYRPLIATPWVWLAVAVPSGIVAILGVPPQGVLLVAAAVPLGLYALWRCTQEPRNPQRRALVISILASAAVCLFMPVGAMFFSAVRYVYENGSVNQIAWGIPWSASWATEKPSIPLELLRMSWLALPAIGLATIAIRWRTRRHGGATEVADVLPFAFVTAFVLLMIPYTLGRIDAGVMSRPGLLAGWSWALLLPLMCWHSSSIAWRPWLLAGAALLGAATSGVGVDLRQLGASTASTIASPPLVDGAAAGLPNLGHAHIDGNHLARVMRVAETLDQFLEPGETYLDLTSRNAHYFYTNRLPPVSVTAPLNLVSTAQQMREIRRIEASKPKVALLQAENFTADGGGLALRSPLLFRYILENYEPQEINGLIIGHRKPHSFSPHLSLPVDTTSVAVPKAGTSSPRSAINVAASSLPDLREARIRLAPGDIRDVLETSDNQIWVAGDASSVTGDVAVELGGHAAQEVRDALWDKSFGRPDLQKAALSWGRSESALMPLLDRVIDLQPLLSSTIDLRRDGEMFIHTGVDPQVHYALDRENIAGRDAGILRLDLQCSSKDFSRGEVFWWGDGYASALGENSLVFTVRSGTMLIPLESSPRWLGMEKISGIRIDIDGDACSEFSIQGVELLQKKSISALREL